MAKEKVDEDAVYERIEQLETLMVNADNKEQELEYAVKINGLRSLLFKQQ